MGAVDVPLHAFIYYPSCLPELPGTSVGWFNHHIFYPINPYCLRACVLVAHTLNALACEMDGRRVSHGLSAAEGTKNEVKSLQQEVGAQTSSLICEKLPSHFRPFHDCEPSLAQRPTGHSPHHRAFVPLPYFLGGHIDT